MKKGMKFMAASLMAASILSISSIAYAVNVTAEPSTVQIIKDPTIEEMLTSVIVKEYEAQAEYSAMSAAFSNVRPFTNFKRAAENHIRILTQLFGDFGYTIPKNTAAAVAPESQEAAYNAGITLEKDQIAMYEKYLKEDLPEDVKLGLERMLNSSERHLQALQNAKEGNLTCPDTSLNGRRNGYPGPGLGQKGRGNGMRRGNGANCGGNNANSCILD